MTQLKRPGLILLLFAALFSLQAQDHSTATTEPVGPVESHILADFVYDSDNRTRESALERELAIPENKTFHTREDLEAYVANKAQDLINLRVLDDVTWAVEETGQDGDTYFYKGTITVKSSWTIYPIPYPKYDSNTGFRIGMKLYYDNFLGTLTNFYLGTNMDIRSDDNGGYEIPQWSFNPKWSHITFMGQVFSIGIMQQYQEQTQYDGDAYVEYYTYHQTAIDLKTSINLPYDFSYSISPSFTFYYGYKDKLADGGSNIQEDDMEFSFSHGLSYSDVDWYVNFRKGFSAGISNSLSLVTATSVDTDVSVIEESSLDSGEFRSTISSTVAGYYPWWRLNPSARLYGFYVFNDETSGLGEYMRGIYNDSMYGNRGLIFNSSLCISVVPWSGVGEAQFQPFFDIGVVSKEDTAVNWDDDLKYSAGADFILYLDKLKSLVARGSIGVDLTIPDWSDSRKIEIEISSSLAY